MIGSPMNWMRRHGSSVRARTTAGAVLVVGLALAIAAIALVVLLRRSLTEDVRATATLAARTVASQYSDGRFPEILPGQGDEEFVEVFDAERRLMAATANLADGTVAAALGPRQSELVRVPFDDDPFLAVAILSETPEGAFIVIAGHTFDSVVESSAALVQLLAIGVPLLLAFVGLVTWWVVGHALQPVESIRAEVTRLSSEELHRRVPVPRTSDEISRLAATMNEMLERLEKSQRRQRRFVSDASHELRSPVATLRQHAEVALSHPDQSSLEELAPVVLAEGLRLQHLVEDLLLLARMDEGVDASTKAHIDLDDIVLEEVKHARDVNGKAIDMSRVSGGRVIGDAKQLARLVANLIDNAVRHCRERVVLALWEQNGEVVLRVDDDGSGVAVEDRDRIFERFVRLDEARDRDSGGSGLGLAIVLEVAAEHGGKATVDESPLGGARFEVRLPHVEMGPKAFS